MKNLTRWLGLALLALLLAACSSPQPASTPAPVATAALPVATVVAEPVVDNCVECHTDKEALIANAKVEEEVPEESKGTG